MSDQNLIKQVRSSLFLILLFSLITYTVLFTTLILFLTNKLHMDERKASDLTAMFFTFHFTLQIIGGWLAGNFFSQRFLLLFGLLLQTFGCVFLSFYHLFWGISFFLGGTGFNLVCINCILTQFFPPEDKSRERAFLYNYTAMNLGAFIGTTVSGFFEFNQNYNYLFAFAAIANIAAIVVLLYKWHILKDLNTIYETHSRKKKQIFMFFGGIFIILLLFILRWITEHLYITNPLVIILGFIMISFSAYLAIKEKDIQTKRKLWAYFCFLLTGVIFWTLYLMIPIGLMLFIQNKIQRHFFGINIPSQWTVNITILVIIIAGPLLAKLFKQLREKGWKITITSQYIASLLSMGLAFIWLSIGLGFPNKEGYINFSFIVISYTLIGLGEILFSPIGYAMIGELIPPKYRSITMGIWFLSAGTGAALADIFSKIAIGSTKIPSQSFSSYSSYESFISLAAISLLTGLILLLASKKLNRWIEHNNTTSCSQ